MIGAIAWLELAPDRFVCLLGISKSDWLMGHLAVIEHPIILDNSSILLLCLCTICVLYVNVLTVV